MSTIIINRYILFVLKSRWFDVVNAPWMAKWDESFQFIDTDHQPANELKLILYAISQIWMTIARGENVMNWWLRQFAITLLEIAQRISRYGSIRRYRVLDKLTERERDRKCLELFLFLQSIPLSFVLLAVSRTSGHWFMVVAREHRTRPPRVRAIATPWDTVPSHQLGREFARRPVKNGMAFFSSIWTLDPICRSYRASLISNRIYLDTTMCEFRMISQLEVQSFFGHTTWENIGTLEKIP